MIRISRLSVKKNGMPICKVAELSVANGERLAIVGDNGSGKTTLLRVLSGLESEYEGQLRIEVRRRKRIYVHQAPFLFRGTALFNVTYGLRLRGKSRFESEELAVNWFERLGLNPRIGPRRVTHLSGGERRRVALARAMVLRPRLLLLDEPLADLDDGGAKAVVAALDELQECTIVVTSPTEVPVELATRNYRLTAE